jgi:hypothetical protein
MSISTNLTCVTTVCNGYSVTGFMPINYINESCFTPQYCNRFLNCTLINEVYSEYATNYTCQNTIATTSAPLPNNSNTLNPKLFMVMFATIYILNIS